MKKRGKDMKKLSAILAMLAGRERLQEKHRDHELIGEYRNFRECHIEADWLLIYAIIENELVLLATETGTHSDLFGK
ncbi:MAG: type II toxin-antitoxin system YafQ family toxin [Spirochaetota bacterium]|jgi:mRNA interferase YafQ|nr:type II toxin-antitoxin system YafQ family toxin [Spirochaetota bacterium]